MNSMSWQDPDNKTMQIIEQRDTDLSTLRTQMQTL